MTQEELDLAKQIARKATGLYQVMVAANPEKPFHSVVILWPGLDKSPDAWDARDVAAFAEIAPRLITKLINALELESKTDAATTSSPQQQKAKDDDDRAVVRGG
jgi:hypothetical protein